MGSTFGSFLFPVTYDTPVSRRLKLRTFEIEQPTKQSNIKITNEYIENEHGQIHYTKCYIPDDTKPIKGMICFCQGYVDHTDWWMHNQGLEFSKRGYILFAFDHQGNGRSDGPHAFIPDFEQLVLNSKYLFAYARRKYGRQYNLKNNQFFLLGLSMGGAIAIRLSLVDTFKWKGMLLAAPMVYIDDDLKPHWIVVNALVKLLKLVPSLGIVAMAPIKEIDDLMTNDEQLKKRVFQNPIMYSEKPRMATAMQLLFATINCCDKWIPQIETPYIVIHGDADKVTSCSHSQMLYDKSSSCRDKQIILYEDAWHLIFEEKRDVIYDDCDKWMMQRLQK